MSQNFFADLPKARLFARLTNSLWGKAVLALALVLLMAFPTWALLNNAIKSSLLLDSQMNVYYAKSLDRYTGEFRAKHPIILGLFSNEGGDFYLYMPGKTTPIQAPPVPVQYQVVKGVSHSSMAIYAILQPYFATADNAPAAGDGWKAELTAYRAEQANTLAQADQLGLEPDALTAVKEILTNNISFIDETLAAGVIDRQKINAWIKEVVPHFTTTIGTAATYQVDHWMEVMAEWKKMIGNQWDQTFGVTNTLYVTRTNNILFTLMAQFFGKEAINDRLLLFETTEFTTKPDTMLSLLTRIVKDRELGLAFFDDYFLMDVELLSTGAREAITRQDGARVPMAASQGSYAVGPAHARIRAYDVANGITPMLPPLAPFHSQEWPWRTVASEGEGPETLQESLEQK